MTSAKLLGWRQWLLRSLFPVNIAYYSYIQAMLADLLSSWCTLQNSHHPSIDDVVRHHCHIFPWFSCYAWVQCISTSLLAAHKKLAAQCGWLRWACTSSSPTYSKGCSSSSRCAKYLTVYLVIKPWREKVWQRRCSTVPRVCVGTVTAHCSALW